MDKNAKTQESESVLMFSERCKKYESQNSADEHGAIFGASAGRC